MIRSARVRRLFLLIGALVLWCAGMVAPAPEALPLRLIGLALLLSFAFGRRLATWMFVAVVAGVEYGRDLPHAALATHVFSDIFLRLIGVIVAPLIFGSLVSGVAGQAHAPGARIGRVGWKSLLYFEVLTTAALVIGMAAIHLSRAGDGVRGLFAAQAAEHVAAGSLGTWQEFLLRMFPENIAKAVADNQILGVAVLALLFGLALRKMSAERRAPLLRLTESLTEAMFACTNLVMLYAPVAIAASLAYTVASAGAGAFASLGKLVATLYAALAAFILLCMLPVALLARIPLRRFLAAVREPTAIGFATSTSEAALPRAMEAMEAFGVPREVVGFVIPAGYSFNLAGSALYISIASLFTAQAAGIALPLKQQAAMLLMLMLTSKGVAGVPRAVLVVLLATADTFHLPTGPMVLLLGIDAIMDMGRTAVNVAGNCLAAAVVARWEGVLAGGAGLPREL